MNISCRYRIHRKHLFMSFVIWITLALSTLRSFSEQISASHFGADDFSQFLLFSDIHFDPFSDPQKVDLLAASSTRSWAEILASPDSLHRTEDDAAIRRKCGPGLHDTSYPLLKSSFDAMKKAVPRPAGVIYLGDFLVHDFACRYQATRTLPSEKDLQEFSSKTARFVIERLQTSFPGIPIYVALGNNDSGCGDYRSNREDPFLASLAHDIAQGLPTPDRFVARRRFAAGGFYEATAPLPLNRTHLLILNDTAMSPRHANCAGERDSAVSKAQLQWLHERLSQSRANREHVWIIGHLPPGLDERSSLYKKDVCEKKAPVSFLETDALSDTIADYADVVTLGLFGHTHMDEFRLIGRDHRLSVAAKIVPSISPIASNSPSFVVGHVSNRTAVLEDYDVYSASNLTGQDATWSLLYSWRQTYSEAEYLPESLWKLTQQFQTENTGTAVSRSFIRFYSPGTPLLGAGMDWHQYACTLSHLDPESYLDCACPAK